MATAPNPAERRRRSPTFITAQPREEPSHDHPFLDLERSDPGPLDPSKTLLTDWVPGVSGRSEKVIADPNVASALGKAPPAALEGPAGNRRSSRKAVWAIAGVSCVTLLGILWLTLGLKKKPSLALSALGEGESREDFVRVEGTQFMLDCRPFYVAGFNAHDLVPKALATPTEHKMFGGREGRDLVAELLKNASESHLNVARVYAHTSDPEHPFLIKPGEYNQDALEAMDEIMDTARQLGMKVMLSFADNWKFHGGVDQMLEWSRTAPKRTQKRPPEQNGDFDDQDLPEKMKEYEVSRHSLFFNDSGARAIYKDYVRAIITRVNSKNGRLYSQDPTLMAWGLLNEPRCETWKVPECKKTFQSWIEEMSKFVKSLDPTHLVSIGAEGFFGEDSPQAKHNPQQWGGQIGQDFVANHLPKSIDYLTVHMWPDNWQRNERSYQEEWLKAHMSVAKKTLKKPLLLEEFGKKLVRGTDTAKFEQSIDQLRNPVFDTTYQLVQAALENNQPLRGSMYWRWDLVIYENQPRADYGVRTYDSTHALIQAHAKQVTRLQASVPPAASCGLQCWVPSDNGQSCENVPQECKKQLKSWRKSATLTYPTKTACCRPGLGAFAQGCST